MVTIHKPSYSGIDEDFAASIYEKYVKQPLKAEVSGFVTLKKGQPAALQLMFKDQVVYLEGNIVDSAQKRPVERKDVENVVKIVSNEIIAENNYNLSVSTYVEKKDTKVKVDIVKLNAEIKDIVAREDVLRKEIDRIIEDIEG